MDTPRFHKINFQDFFRTLKHIAMTVCGPAHTPDEGGSIASPLHLVSDERVHAYGCRCGGGFNISEEEVQEEEAQRRRQGEAEEEEEEHSGVVVCCDTCSLSVCVTWP